MTNKYHIKKSSDKICRLNRIPISLSKYPHQNSKLRALISNNFGRRKNDPAKDRKALETYVELRGYKQHDNQWTCQNGTTKKSNLDEIAKELNMSKRNLQRALRIERNLTDSMKELLDTGEKLNKISKSKLPRCKKHQGSFFNVHNFPQLE